jgi:hypothetical protein
LGLKDSAENSKRKKYFASRKIFSLKPTVLFGPVVIYLLNPFPGNSTPSTLSVNLSGRAAVHIRVTVPMLLLVSHRPRHPPMLLEREPIQQ